MEDRLEKKIEERVAKQLKKIEQSVAIEQRIKLPDEVMQENLSRVKEENKNLLHIIDVWCQRLDPNHTPLPSKGDRKTLLRQLQEEEKKLLAQLAAKKKQREAAVSREAEVIQLLERHASIDQLANDRFASFVDASVEGYELQNHVGNMQAELQRLQRYSYLEQVYRFEFRENFGIINGVEMGTDSEKPTNFSLEDTCFGFGHLLSMIANIFRKFGFKVPQFEISPCYNRSKIEYKNKWFALFPENQDLVAASDSRWPTAKASPYSSGSSKKSRPNSSTSSSRRCAEPTLSWTLLSSNSTSQRRTRRSKTSGSNTSCRNSGSEASTCASTFET